VLILLLAFSATLSQAAGIAVSVRSASGYGPECGSSPGLTNCEAFSGTTSTLTFNGTDYTVTQFFINSPGTIYNLIDLGNIQANTTFSLPALFALNDPGIFGCDASFDGATVATDSDGHPLSTDCTAGLTDSTLANIINNGDGTFTTDKNFSVSGDLWFEATAPVATPEPASLVLLGVGLFAVGRKFRRAR